VVLLLHGLPTSSFQYRELIPRLADGYRVIAPDLPGFGFTDVPEKRGYKYSFDALAYRRDNPNASVQFLNTGHFALETHVEEIAAAMRQFLAANVHVRRSLQLTF
jgi:alpha-beta hydrolase superfamily lysophospholipase